MDIISYFSIITEFVLFVGPVSRWSGSSEEFQRSGVVRRILCCEAMAVTWRLSSDVSSIKNLKLVCSTVKRRDEKYRCHAPVCTHATYSLRPAALHHLSLRRLGQDCSNCRTSPRPTLCVSRKKGQLNVHCCYEWCVMPRVEMSSLDLQ